MASKTFVTALGNLCFLILDGLRWPGLLCFSCSTISRVDDVPTTSPMSLLSLQALPALSSQM
jgi:hypothetical protein